MEFKEKVYDLLVSLGKFTADGESARLEVTKDSDGKLSLSEFIKDDEVKEKVSNIEKSVRKLFKDILNLNELSLSDIESAAIDSGLLKLI